MNTNEWIEKEIARVERETYSGDMPAANKSVLRQMLRTDERYAEREEMEHSHSPVGDWNGMVVRD